MVASLAAGLAAPVSVAGSDESVEWSVEAATTRVATDQGVVERVGDESAVEGAVGAGDEVVDQAGGDGSVPVEIGRGVVGAEQGVGTDGDAISTSMPSA